MKYKYRVGVKLITSHTGEVEVEAPNMRYAMEAAKKRVSIDSAGVLWNYKDSQCKAIGCELIVEKEGKKTKNGREELIRIENAEGQTDLLIEIDKSGMLYFSAFKSFRHSISSGTTLDFATNIISSYNKNIENEYLRGREINEETDVWKARWRALERWLAKACRGGQKDQRQQYGNVLAVMQEYEERDLWKLLEEVKNG